ncbi:MAG: hypothetical protein E7480_02830 [Ruminococcaceae bacterium]|nr:hypothetical protein [Oscillospiraceae bacterium]
MLKGKFRVITTAAVCTVITVSAVYIGFAADPGSAEDPIVTKSYVDNAITTALENYIKNSDLNSALSSAQAITDIKQSILQAQQDVSSAQNTASQAQDTANQAQSSANQAQSTAEQAQSNAQSTSSALQNIEDKLDNYINNDEKYGYKVINLQKGKLLSASEGTEIIIRSGAASCVSPSSSIGIYDYTDGSFCANGARLTNEHYYVFDRNGRGIRAASDCVLLIRGKYTID